MHSLNIIIMTFSSLGSVDALLRDTANELKIRAALTDVVAQAMLEHNWGLYSNAEEVQKKIHDLCPGCDLAQDIDTSCKDCRRFRVTIAALLKVAPRMHTYTDPKKDELERLCSDVHEKVSKYFTLSRLPEPGFLEELAHSADSCLHPAPDSVAT